MTSFAELRTAVVARLEDAGLTVHDYLAETLSPPCVVVHPGQPYLDPRSGRDDVMLGELLVNLDVLVLITPTQAKADAAAIDTLIGRTYAALHGVYNVRLVSRPGRLPEVASQRLLGAVIRLEEYAEEPHGDEE